MNLEQKQIKKIFLTVNIVLSVLLFSFLGYNQMNINNINKSLGIKNEIIKEMEGWFGNKNQKEFKITTNGKRLTGDIMQDSINLVISAGIPDIYGAEMGVSFDEVQKAMNIMRKYDPSDLKPKGERIIPKGENTIRYIDIAGKISCEYCCSAKSIISQNGKAACGCAHSMAMRGLTAYLLENHPELSNDEILRELARWKGLYFPKQMIKKMAKQLQTGNYTPDIASLIIETNLPSYGQTRNGKAPLPSEIENLPSMVGGC